jgi:hypothetical protein
MDLARPASTSSSMACQVSWRGTLICLNVLLSDASHPEGHRVSGSTYSNATGKWMR